MIIIIKNEINYKIFIVYGDHYSNNARRIRNLRHPSITHSCSRQSLRQGSLKIVLQNQREIRSECPTNDDHTKKVLGF